jgi:hypothetical protein
LPYSLNERRGTSDKRRFMLTFKGNFFKFLFQLIPGV